MKVCMMPSEALLIMPCFIDDVDVDGTNGFDNDGDNTYSCPSLSFD